MSEQINRYRVGIYLIQCILLNLTLYFSLGEIFTNDSRHHYISIVLIIAIIIADYLSRAYITNIFAFFFVHLVFITGTAVVPVTILDKILTSIISIMFLIISVVFWKTEDKKNDVNIFEIPLGMLVFIFPVYIHTSIYYSSFLKWFIYISAIIFLILCLIRNYLNKIRIQLLSNNTYTKSLYQSFKANFYMINLFNVGLIIVFTCVNIIYSDEISTSIAKFFKMIGKFLLGFLPKMGKNDKLQETTKLIEETSFNGSTEESMTLQA